MNRTCKEHKHFKLLQKPQIWRSWPTALSAHGWQVLHMLWKAESSLESSISTGENKRHGEGTVKKEDKFSATLGFQVLKHSTNTMLLSLLSWVCTTEEDRRSLLS